MKMSFFPARSPMAAKKRSGKQEPLLNTVARKLGHAAGTLTNVTHKFTENLSTLPETVTTRVRKASIIGTRTGRSEPRARRPKKKTRNTVGIRKAKAVGRVKRQGSSGKTRR